MCGIAGIFNLENNNAINAECLTRMLHPIAHRGPDAEGVRIYDGAAALGHRRLSILDLSADANQPFESADRTLAITFNGEIFNYLELRSELEAKGRRFRTNSDTEVLLQAYEEWGEEAVPRFNGMWAFAILDRQRRTLFCSRDRFGIKPFVWAQTDSRFVFASEIKSILAFDPGLATPDYTTIDTILRSAVGYRPTATCFSGIHRLAPAHNAVVSSSGISVHRYWDYPMETDDSIGASDAASRFRELLTDSIRLRTRSDVPVGSTLSSGIDSSAIACLLRTFSSGSHETFSASYQEEKWNEASRAEELALSLDMKPNSVPALPSNFLETLRRCLHHLESPVQNPTVVPLWNIMEVAKKKVVVLLEGQGADELLAGYDQACFPAAFADDLAAARLRSAVNGLRRQAGAHGWLPTALWGLRTGAPWSQAILGLVRGESGVHAGPLAAARRASTIRQNTFRRHDGRLNRLLRRQHEVELGRLLHYGDAISMAHSIESRLPFLDYRLVEFAFRLPGHLKLSEGIGKKVLRDAVRGIVPDDILDNNRKLGFRTPIDRWFRETPEETLLSVLLSKESRQRGIFSIPRLTRVIENHRLGRVDLSHYLFRWLTTELWFQEFIDS